MELNKFFLIILLGFSVNTLTAQKIWNEQNGFVIIEAEAVCSELLQSEGWKLEVSPEGYSGSGYIKWMGASLYGHDYEKVAYIDMPSNRKMIYQVRINKPGKYFWRVRNIHEKEDGDNDCFVSVDKQDFVKTYDWDENQFSWDETGNWSSRIFENGIINFEVAGRSKGFAIDRIAIFHEDLAIPGEKWIPKGPYTWMDTCIWAKPILNNKNNVHCTPVP